MAWKKCYGCKKRINPLFESWIQVSVPEGTFKKHCHLGHNTMTARKIVEEQHIIRYKVEAQD